jgi:hypothetical protein
MMEEVKIRKSNKVQLRKRLDLISPARLGWQDSANCLGGDCNEFIYSSDFPSRKTREKLSGICKDCRVLLTCRLEAVRTQEVGWWGGMDEQERIEWALEHIPEH